MSDSGPLLDRLSRSFFARPPARVARELLGCALLSRIASDQWTGGIIVESEAYLSSGDPASHSARGKTPRNRSMFALPGTLYVYTIHAKHCANLVTEGEGVGSAVLIRALQPIWNRELMAARRGVDAPQRLTSGPAMLCHALALDLRHDGVDLLASDEVVIGRVYRRRPRGLRIGSGPRVGISAARDLSLRFFVDRNRFVSGTAAIHSGKKNDELPDPARPR